MGMTSRWWDKAMGNREPTQSPAASPGSRAAPSAPRPSGTYSLQGEEDLFRDPFADFAPSGR
jgi:hypothetical protein